MQAEKALERDSVLEQKQFRSSFFDGTLMK